MNSAELLKQYDAIWQLTQRMLAVANQGEWDQLIEFVQLRATLTDALMKLDSEDLWGREEQGRKAELIRKILSADDEIKKLTQSWMGELQEMLSSLGTEKKLQQTYEAP